MDALIASYASCPDSDSDSDKPRPKTENHQAPEPLPPPPISLLRPPNSLGNYLHIRFSVIRFVYFLLLFFFLTCLAAEKIEGEKGKKI